MDIKTTTCILLTGAVTNAGMQGVIYMQTSLCGQSEYAVEHIAPRKEFITSKMEATTRVFTYGI